MASGNVISTFCADLPCISYKRMMYKSLSSAFFRERIATWGVFTFTKEYSRPNAPLCLGVLNTAK